MVVVVGVLVILAGLVVPSLDSFKLRANKAASATDMADLSRTIQQFYAQYSAYPDRWDSLMDSSGTTLWQAHYDANMNLTPGLDSELTGAPIVGSPHKLTTTTINTDGYMRSLTRMGIRTVLDAVPGTSASDLPTDCFTSAPRSLANGSTVATINPADDDGKAIINHIYPDQKDNKNPVVPSDKILVVFGIGPRNTMMGKAVQEIPVYPNRDATQEYARFLAVFEASNDGSPACLKTVLGADGDTIGSETAEYYQK
jgi:Tfp pilus assembly protein PilE